MGKLFSSRTLGILQHSLSADFLVETFASSVSSLASAYGNAVPSAFSPSSSSFLGSLLLPEAFVTLTRLHLE
jgi:hypothetical protein